MEFFQGEANKVNLTIQNSAEEYLDCRSAHATIACKANAQDSGFLFCFSYSLFDYTNAESGALSIDIPASATNKDIGEHIGQLRLAWYSGNITVNSFEIKILKSIF